MDFETLPGPLKDGFPVCLCICFYTEISSTSWMKPRAGWPSTSAQGRLALCCSGIRGLACPFLSGSFRFFFPARLFPTPCGPLPQAQNSKGWCPTYQMQSPSELGGIAVSKKYSP